MKEELTIATFNWQNTYHPYQMFKDKVNCYDFSKFIIENNIDILGTQETLNRNLKICQQILKNYSINGKGRFKITGKFYPISLANETNSIISKVKPIYISTITLPWFGSAFPRIITKAVFKDFIFLNTHLDNVNPKVKKSELEFIYQIISRLIKENKNIVLTGDFNMTLKNKNFKQFIYDLKRLGINRVENDIPTCKSIKSGPIDHVFVPAGWDILEVSIVETGISDHKSIIVRVKKEND